MTDSFTLMRITTLKSNGDIFTYSEITEDGLTATHRDQISQHMYNVLLPFFEQHIRGNVGAQLTAKIAERWQESIADPTPRWAEFTIPNPGLTKDGKPLDVAKIVFGVGTFFHVSSPSSHFALREHVLSDVVVKQMRTSSNIRLIFDGDAKPISVDFGGGKIVRAPFPTSPQFYFFPKAETDPA
jgi:hypothetical protein